MGLKDALNRGLDKSFGGLADKQRAKLTEQAQAMLPPGESVQALAFAHVGPGTKQPVAFAATERGLHLFPRSLKGDLKERIDIPPAYTRVSLDRERKMLTVDYFHPEDTTRHVASHSYELALLRDVDLIAPYAQQAPVA